ncbi:hypothetical protein M426DRAFT_17435 [Hypoxylon sp. CI-4A]|nr:hypothetical protein M426DRAFT_17435 [Hypoxylon sp. CI-4A]
MSLKRQRPCSSDGDSGLALLGQELSTVVAKKKVLELLNNQVDKVGHDEEHKDYLACPFWKHNPTRYLHVKSSCTGGVGFKDIGKLTEHIRRVHCLWNGCEKCRRRFNNRNKGTVGEEKRNHMKTCVAPKELTNTEAEWMTAAQDAEYQQLNFQKDKGDPKECYKKICCALWGPNCQNAIPSPYHSPGFQISFFYRGILKGLALMEQEKDSDKTGQDAKSDPTAQAPVVIVQHPGPIDPMLSRQTLSDLSNGPEPFYRGRDQEDSGVWSRDSDFLAAFPSAVRPEPLDGDEIEQDVPMLPQMDSTYTATGTWSYPTDRYELSLLEMDQDDDEIDFR